MENATEKQVEHHRVEDPPLLKIRREVPIEWLAGVIATIFIWGTTNQFAQWRQAELIEGLTKQITILSSDINSKNLKDVEHDLLIADLTRRMLAMEAKKP